MKSFKAMMSEVAQPEPAEEKAFKAQHTVTADKHPVALETQHKGTKSKAKRKADQEGDANYDLAYESVELDEGEDKEPASPDEASMAMKQADFLAYVGREMKDHLKAGKEFPEWMQNKLSKLNQAAQDLHSNFGAHGEDDMDEALSPKQKKIDHNKNGKIDGQDLAMIRAKKNEETNLAELSKSTLGSYAKKAKTDIAHRSYDQGSDDEMGADRSKRNDRLLKNRSKGVDKAVDRLTKEGFASDAQRKAIWASKNEKGVKEELKGDQHKIDKNKNGKIDAHDFKLLKKESLDELKQSIFNAYVIEAEKKIVSPFDLKNYRSQIPTKAGEKAGFDSKKVSTGTVYSRKPVKEAAYEKGMDDKKKVVVKGVKGMKSTPFTKTFRNMAAYDKWSDSDAAGDYEVHQVMNEEIEQIDELSKGTLRSYINKAGGQMLGAATKAMGGHKFTDSQKAQLQKRADNVDKAVDKFKVKKEEVELDEAFKVGIVKLKDNTSMVLKKEDADILNKLMSGMSAGSVKKMTETAMKDKNGFAEILAFAKEAV